MAATSLKAHGWRRNPAIPQAVNSTLGGTGLDVLTNDNKKEVRYPVVHIQGGSAIRRPLMVVAVCAVAAIGYLARDFLIPPQAPSCWR